MGATRVVFGGLVFGAAFLLFAVEPMAAKQLLPVLGGSSAVWITCLVFFQAVLLLGYLYAHWMVRSRRIWTHIGLLVVGVGVLGMGSLLRHGLGLEVHRGGAGAALHPVQTIFGTLGITIGLPFLLLAATSPLLQVWWVRLEGGQVPYGLFALSNLGSLLGLMLYPLVIEPGMTLASQRRWWAVGFVLYAVLCAGAGWRVSRHGSGSRVRAPEGEAGRVEAQGRVPRERSEASRRWMWFLLPMAAAMQLCAVTSHLSQDVAAIPMLWVLPLGVYLVTFIVAFEAPGLYRRWAVARLLAVMLASLGYALSKIDTTLPIGMAIGFYMLELFVACWFCHAEAYRLRPAVEEGGAEESTVFYLMVAAGGAAGTFLVAIASPMVFRSNYDLAISFFVTAALAAVVTWRDGWTQRALWVTGSGLLLGLLVMLHVGFERHALMRARNFYGALRVTESQTDNSSAEESDARAAAASGEVGTGPVRTLMNGRIRHGTQMLDEERRRIPTSYYAEDSGVGVALRACCAGRPKRVGVVGLGVGTLAAYGNPGDRMQFFEINPLVEPIARNLFTYLKDSPASISVVEGDGRAMLAQEAPQGFDVLVVDAFSGDAIPLHLLTREAMEVYQRQLAPGGVVAFHVSNSYLDLAPEVARLAESVGMQAWRVESWAVPAEGAYRSTWVLVSADPGFFLKPAVASAVTRIPVSPGLRVWTDDYSSLFDVVRWGR